VRRVKVKKDHHRHRHRHGFMYKTPHRAKPCDDGNGLCLCRRHDGNQQPSNLNALVRAKENIRCNTAKLNKAYGMMLRNIIARASMTEDETNRRTDYPREGDQDHANERSCHAVYHQQMYYFTRSDDKRGLNDEVVSLQRNSLQQTKKKFIPLLGLLNSLFHCVLSQFGRKK